MARIKATPNSLQYALIKISSAQGVVKPQASTDSGLPKAPEPVRSRPAVSDFKLGDQRTPTISKLKRRKRKPAVRLKSFNSSDWHAAPVARAKVLAKPEETRRRKSKQPAKTSVRNSRKQALIVSEKSYQQHQARSASEAVLSPTVIDDDNDDDDDVDVFGYDSDSASRGSTKYSQQQRHAEAPFENKPAKATLDHLETSVLSNSELWARESPRQREREREDTETWLQVWFPANDLSNLYRAPKRVSSRSSLH